MRVAVFGGGNGAFATAGDLALRGHDVVLCEAPEMRESIDPLRGTHGIDVEALPATGLPSGHATLTGVTTDPGEALAHADVALLVVPSFAHARFAAMIAPALRRTHALLVAPGNLWGALRIRRQLTGLGAPAGVLVGEAECMMYAVRKLSPTAVRIRGFKHRLGVAAVECARSGELLERFLPLYPTLRQLDNVVQTGLGNVNPFLHPPILLSNLGRMIEGASWRFYVDGVSPAVAAIIQRLDEERIAVTRALNVSLVPLRDLLLMWYGPEGAAGETLHAVIHTVPGYQYSMSPSSLATSRYLLEDIPFGLVPFVRLASFASVRVPIAAALVALAQSIVGDPDQLAGPGGIEESDALSAVIA